MPTYEYKCPDCDHRFQIVRGIKDEDPGYKCEKCDKEMSRVFALSGFSLKGSGFYSTDNR